MLTHCGKKKRKRCCLLAAHVSKTPLALGEPLSVTPTLYPFSQQLSLSLNPTIKNPILGPPTFHQDHSHSSARTAKCHLKAAQLPQQPPSSTVAPPPPTSTLLVVKPATIPANPHPPYTPPSPQSKSKASKKHST